MFEKDYPYLSSWIDTVGWIEIGTDHMSDSLLRILNEGGTVWEDSDSVSINEALEKGEKYLKEDVVEEFGIELEID